MPAQETLLELIRLLYGAAAGHESWTDFLQRYAQAVRAPFAALMLQDVATQMGIIGANVGGDPHMQRLYDEHYCALNVWTIQAPHLFQPGLVAVGEQAGLSDRQFMSTEFYQDYLRPQDFYHTFGGVITRNRSATSYITSLRSKSMGAYGEDEIGLLNTLMPHLQCAMRVQQRLSAAGDHALAANDVLHRLPWGVIVVDSGLKAIWMNQAAEAILRRKDGLEHSKGGLRTASREDTNRLRNSLRAAVQTANGGMAAGAVLSIPRPSGSRSFTLLVAPLPVHHGSGFGRPAAVVLVGDPELKAAPSTDALRRLFELTRAEASLAAALMQGKTVEDHAEEASISLNTARTHLKRIFLKTSTTRQSDLVRLLLRSVAGLVS
jgi:DNA-binding CsgD family transcriptional regulator